MMRGDWLNKMSSYPEKRYSLGQKPSEGGGIGKLCMSTCMKIEHLCKKIDCMHCLIDICAGHTPLPCLDATNRSSRTNGDKTSRRGAVSMH